MPSRRLFRGCLALSLLLLVASTGTPAEAQRGRRAGPAAAGATPEARSDRSRAAAPGRGIPRPAARPRGDRRPTTLPRARPTRDPVFRALESPRLGLLVRIARSDPFLRSSMDAVVRDGAKLISNTGKSEQLEAREAWVPLVSNRPLRRAVIRAILRDIGDRSEQVKSLIRAQKNDAVWDTVFVGAGVHTAAAANALSRRDPGHAMLVIEAGELVSSNFASLGETIAINSSSRQETGAGVQPFGRGNNNPAEGPIGVPDLAGDKWPAADTLSDVATVSLHTSGADVITRSRVTRVSERGPGQNWPARYRVEMAGGLTIYTASVVLGTGLGKPALDIRGQQLIARETAKVDLRNPDRVPRIMYYSQAMALANQSAAPRDPYRASARGRRAPRIAVIGGGDSGRTFLELMYGLAPSGAYDGPGRLDRAQRGEVGALDWVVGPDGPTDCKSYLDRVRARYARISPEIKSGKATLINRKAVAVSRAGQKFRLTYDDGSSAVYDRIILATGFENQAPAILDPVLPSGFDRTVPFTTSNALERVGSRVPGAGNQRRPVAKRVVGQDVYLIGPSAGNDLVARDQILVSADRSQGGQPQAQQIAISENLASIKFLVPYSAALARTVLSTRKADGPTLDTSTADVRRRVALRTARGQPSRGKRIRRDKVADADDPASDPARTGLEPVVLKHEMATVLDSFQFPGLTTLEVSAGPAPGGLLIRAPRLDDRSASQLRGAIESNYALVQMLTKFSGVGKTVTFRAETSSQGGIEAESLTMTY